VLAYVACDAGDEDFHSEVEVMISCRLLGYNSKFYAKCP